MGRWLMVAGLALLFVGAALTWAPWLVSWFGRLPGDIRIDGERGKIFIPVTSMLLLSVVLSLVLTFFRR
ncbi:MAG: DUF2905 domain-containing protein [Gammaproteobacteria bacterium]